MNAAYTFLFGQTTSGKSVNDKIFLPRMEALKIYDIAKCMLQKEGVDESKIEYIGIRPGEKINEDMVK